MLRMNRAWVALAVGVLAMVLAGCGGGGGEATVASSPAAPAATDPAGVADPSTEVGLPTDLATANAGGELPLFLPDLSRVCTTQVGFPGMASYNQEPGPHPVALFEEFEGETDNYIETSRTLPKAWVIEQDDDFADNSELAAIELVGCSDRLDQKATGTKCDFDGDDGKPITVELVDTTYEVAVYEAATGEEVGRATIQARTKECPTVAFLEEGQTELIEEPSDDQLIKALKEFVAP